MRAWMLGSLLLVGSCDDYVRGVIGGDDPTGGADGWCGVQSIIGTHCLSCHGAAALGGLDLSGDAHAALVGVAAATDPSLTLVVAGDADASFLIRKLTGDLQAGEGGVMPPGAGLDADSIDVVRTWVADGASDVCDGPIDSSEPVRYHPIGFSLGGQHGPAAKQQDEACITCHGDDLNGRGDAVSCDTCHTPDDPPAWRTDCTFCHGDPMDGTGAPPVHISGVDDGRDATFVPHRVHTDTTGLHVAFACTHCHDTPDDVLTSGHLFVGDTTPGQAEVDLSGGLSSRGTWTANTGTCGQLWCHGDGQGANGTMDHLGAVSGCADCHPSLASSRNRWNDMSGEHRDHLHDVGATCADCHHATTTDNTSISTLSEHVDGEVDVVVSPSRSVTWNGAWCTGACHGHTHTSEDRWD